MFCFLFWHYLSCTARQEAFLISQGLIARSSVANKLSEAAGKFIGSKINEASDTEMDTYKALRTDSNKPFSFQSCAMLHYFVSY